MISSGRRFKNLFIFRTSFLTRNYIKIAFKLHILACFCIDIPVDKILDFEQGLFDFIDTKYPQIPESIKETKELSEDTEKLLVSAIEEFKKTFNC